MSYFLYNAFPKSEVTWVSLSILVLELIFRGTKCYFHHLVLAPEQIIGLAPGLESQVCARHTYVLNITLDNSDQFFLYYFYFVGQETGKYAKYIPSLTVT